MCDGNGIVARQRPGSAHPALQMYSAKDVGVVWEDEFWSTKFNKNN